MPTCRVAESVGDHIGEASHTMPGTWWVSSMWELITMTGAYVRAQRSRLAEKHNLSLPFTTSHLPSPVWLCAWEGCSLQTARGGVGSGPGAVAKDGGGGRAHPSSSPFSPEHDNSNQLLLFPNLFPWLPPRLPLKSVTRSA